MGVRKGLENESNCWLTYLQKREIESSKWEEENASTDQVFDGQITCYVQKREHTMVNHSNCRVCRFNLLYYHLLLLEHSGIMRLLRFSVKVSLTLNNASEATSLFIYKVYFATVFPLFIASFWKLSIEGVVVWILLSTNTLTPSIVRKWLL